jgi:ubiquinone biosynthesis protein
MLLEALTATRDLSRIHGIASVLIRHGFGDAVRRLGMAGVLERAGKTLHWTHAEELARLDPPARVRRALEELGTTFVKLGQILSTRVDLFAPEWIAEFETLQDQAAPVPFEQLLAQLTEDLQADPDTVFAALEREPLAAGSIAQVHRARLHDGSEVVLKIRRPGIRPVVEADLRLLARFAEIAEAESPALARFQPRALVQHFAQSLRRELDLETEAYNAERIAANLSADANIVVPAIHWQWTGERLNVQQFVAGIPGRDLKAVDAAGLDRKLLARRGTQAVLQMTLEDGFFHADPHPGNVYYLPDNRIAFIDFGMVGHLNEARREEVVDLLYGLALREHERVADLVMRWSGNASVDFDALSAEIEAFTDEFHGVPLGGIRLSRLLGSLTAIMRRHHIALPPDLALMFKAAISLEGMGRLLDPEFDMVSEATPFLRRAVERRRSPAAVLRRSRQGMGAMLDLLGALPGDLRRLLRLARRGALSVNIDVPRLDAFAQQIERSGNRLTMGIITAALIIGSSIVTTTGGGDGWLTPSLLGLLGFVAAVLIGLWLVISIWRGDKHR